MATRQVIVTTIFGPQAETFGEIFGTFSKVADTELHAFVYNQSLPKNQHPKIKYHLVEHDPAFVSVRRDALFRRWAFPDKLDAEYALVVDGTDVICVRALPPFPSLLRGGVVAGSPEWMYPIRIPGQGATSSYLNAGVTFWDLNRSRKIREEIIARGRAHYRGPYDDQTALNEVVNTKYFEDMVVLPSQFNWRAQYHRTYWSWKIYFHFWPRVDHLDGVYIYHNAGCYELVARDIQTHPPAAKAELPALSVDKQPLSRGQLFWRRLVHRWLHA